MRLDCITPLILTFNEETNLPRTLAALSWAHQIVVVDSLSTDGTLDILKRDARVRVIQRPFDSPAAQCNLGLSCVDTEWVLSLDADYVCEPALATEIAGLPDDPVESGFRVSFTYLVNGTPLRATLYPPRTVLYRRERAKYETDGHTQRVRVAGSVSALRARIRHDDRKSLARWFASQQRYASEEAIKLRSVPTADLSMVDRLRRKAWLAPALMPAYCLFVKGLILDGRAGWYDTAQRALSEVLLSLELVDQNVRS